MRKLYLITCAIIACVFFTDQIYAQAPAFAYTPTVTLITGQTMTPLKPKHMGGAVPKEIYSKAANIAGSGYYGQKDTLADYSSFGYPLSAAIDRFGNIYVADANFNCIRKISDGQVTTFAGSLTGEKGGRNGQGNNALFNFPTGVAVDHAGNVYVADFSNSLIRKITPSGFVSTFAGNQNSGSADGIGTAASFSLPYAIYMDYDNVLWVADTYSNKIRKITADGIVSTITPKSVSPTDPNQMVNTVFNIPKGITKDTDGNLYVSEEEGNSIKKIDLTTNTAVNFAADLPDHPIGITTDNANNVYVSSRENFVIYKYTPDGHRADTQFPAFSGGHLKGTENGTDTLTHYGGNMGLFFDGVDHIVVADASKDMIRKVAVNGYSVFPRLPDGLTIDEEGTISGIPTTVQSAKTYQVFAHNDGGESSFNISIGVGSGPQVITFNAIKAATYGDKDLDSLATSNSKATITYSSDNTKIATIVNNKIHIVGAGTVNITANQATNTNYQAAVPVSQSLQVNKAHLSASVFHYFKIQGKSNPDFKVYYYGFFHGDTTSVIIDQPLATTTATKDSPVGDYPITLSGGNADNYDFKFTNGTLTVFPDPKIAVTGSAFIAAGDSVLLSVTPATGYDYQWSLNGDKIDGATGPTYYAKETGAYTVSITKDGFTAVSLYQAINVQLQLPANNFTIKVNSVSCKGDNNGSIFISAAKKLNYIATVTINAVPTQYPFTDTLTLSKLSPGNYSVCISVENELFNQCYQLNVTEPKDLSAFSTIDKPSNSLTLQLDGGSTYSINLNDVVYTTKDSEIKLPLKAGVNKVVITTDRLCQGIIQKTIDMSSVSLPYPNPFTSILSVNVGGSPVNNIKVDVVSVLSGKSVFADQQTNKSGVLQFDLSGVAAGIYYFNLDLDNRKLGYKIIKK